MRGGSASNSVGTRASVLLVGLLVVVIAALVEASLPAVRYSEGADEGHYLSYARTLATGGPAGLAQATRDYLVAPDAGIFPPPTRVGYLLPAALALRIFGDGFNALSQLSLGAHLLLILASFAFARRRIGSWPALGVATLLGCSPLLLGLARRALADSVVTLLLAIALWTWLEILRPTAGRPRRNGWLLAFVVAFAGAVLAKESSVLFLVPLGLVALVRNLTAPRPIPWLRLAVAVVAPLIAAAAIWTALAGSPSGVFRLAEVTLGGPAHNLYAADFGSGPWTRYLVDFLLLSPWTLLLALAGAGTLALRRVPDDPQRALARDCLLFAAGALAIFAPLTKNVRYLALLELPIAVLALWFLSELARHLRERRLRLAAVLAAMAILGLALGGLWTADALFVKAGIYDPVTFNLLRAREMVPGR